ncbi:MAG: HD-GYP domain-containing protein [Firmicutes bacterium]|nr:HD-GYP domain-containing protein [Bacillota bacterium]
MFPLVCPIAAHLGPFWSAVLTGLGSIRREEFSYPLMYFARNRGAFVLSAGLAALTLQYAPAYLPMTAVFPLASATYMVVNVGVWLPAAIAKSYANRRDINYAAHVLELVRTFIPSTAFAALFYYLYGYFGVWGVLAGYVTLTAIHSWVLSGHLDVTYRLNLVKALLRAAHAKDPLLMLHLERVAYFSRKLARQYGYSRLKLHIFDEACYLHDIGKLEITDSILLSTSKLTPEQYEVMRTHPTRGAQFLQDLFSDQRYGPMIRNIVLYHHEHYDGSGYPEGLAGDKIPLEARIVAVADAWDAMTGQRPYRTPLDKQSAIGELRRNAGTQFDPRVVETFINILNNDHTIDREAPGPKTLEEHKAAAELTAGLREAAPSGVVAAENNRAHLQGLRKRWIEEAFRGRWAAVAYALRSLLLP